MSFPRLAVFAYAFPHRKTRDFIVDLFAAGVRDMVVLGAPKKQLAHHDSLPYFPSSLLPEPPTDTEVLCERLGLPFHRMDHSSQAEIASIVRADRLELGIVAGARIIPGKVISLFERGIVNFHPGILPETSGLDSFYYTIKKDAPAGVTAHLIDSRVDAGQQLFFRELSIRGSESAEVLVENLYRLQRHALGEFIPLLRQERFQTSPIIRPKKNLPMAVEEKLHVLSGLESWRSRQHGRQVVARFFHASETGDLPTLRALASVSPSLISQANEKGWVPLVVACFNRQEAVARWLVDSGASVNHCNAKGTSVFMYAKTPLMLNPAADYGLLDYLISSGADLAHRDCHGKTVLDYASSAGDSRMVAYLKSKLECNRAMQG